MNKQTPKASTADIAHTTAFLYAGALSDSNGKIDLDVWSGHTGFVSHCAMYAEKIENWVTEQQEQDFPGVYAYELIEPFGQWLVEDCTDRSTEAVLAEFQKRYAEWMAAGQAEYAAALAKHDQK